ncbi:MAG: radical SAM protein [Clostridia bacterium]|nr:radical SAM protein [Clostridia bacterium]MBO5315749.1 radical SAM protein [Clostridia bacterium]
MAKSEKKYSRAYVEITNICNRSCSFCPGTKREPRRMTKEEFAHICSELLPLTDYVYLHVMGEPLTHPELPELIKIANKAGLKCAITTNGTLLDKCGDSLIEAGVYKVSLSVHSFEKNDETGQKNYLKTLCDFADKASYAGVLTVFRLWNRGHDEGRNDITLDYLKERFPEEWKYGARGARIRNKLHLEYGDRFAWPDKDAQEGDANVFCYGLRDHFGILCDGRVIPCCLDREGVIILGNVYETPLAEILDSERAKNILAGFNNRCAVEELCRKCGYARRF